MPTLYTEKEIQDIVKDIADKINSLSEEPPVLICVLNGAFMFFSDLTKQIKSCYIDFIRVKSYEGVTQGDLRITKYPELSLADKNIFIIDDIYDSGNTMDFIIKKIKLDKPKSITPVTLFKRYSSDTPEGLIFGHLIKDEAWLYGYGMDGEKGLYRNLPEVKGTHIEVD